MAKSKKKRLNCGNDPKIDMALMGIFGRGGA
jgi:hypothetical protein